MRLNAWLKEVAPSGELRRWFAHDPARWVEFRRRYFAELNGKPETWQPILKASRRGNVTLLYSARDTEHNNAVALKAYLKMIERGKIMTILLDSYHQTTAFTPERFNPVLVAENERVKVIVACFEPGQFIPVHQPGVDLTLTILEGEAMVVAGEEEAKLGPGCLVFVPAGQARGIKAETRLVVLHVVTPPPTFEDHTEVMAGLKRGSWR